MSTIQEYDIIEILNKIQPILHLTSDEMELTQSKITKLPRETINVIIKFCKIEEKSKIDDQDTFEEKDCIQYAIAYGNFTHLERSFISQIGIIQRSIELIRYAFLRTLLQLGNNPEFTNLYNSIISCKLYQDYCNYNRLDKSDVELNNTALIDMVNDVIGFKRANDEMKLKIIKNKNKIHKVLGLFGCDLINFITEKMKDSSLIDHVNVFILIRTVFVLIGDYGIGFERRIKLIYILWLLDNNINSSNEDVIYISSDFERFYEYVVKIYKEDCLLLEDPFYKRRNDSEIKRLSKQILIEGKKIFEKVL